MAAADEEGGQSDSKKDDPASHETSKQFSTIHQEIENQLVRQGASYENRVSAVLSGWEHLAGTVQGDVSEVQPLATFLYKWSLRLILQGEWPGLAQIVKTRLGVTLQRCSKVAILDPLCRTLIPLVSDPWGHPTLKAILSETEVEDSEASKYISNESWEVVRVRVDTMVESRCEELAFRVLKICVRCIRLRSEGMEVPLYTDEDHNHFVDLYFVLLYKFQRKTFLDEVKALDVNEGVDLVRRLVAKKDKTKVWKHRLKIADLAIQIFLATTIVKKYGHTFWSVFNEWCGVQEAAAVAEDILCQMIRKYLQLAESSQHIYTMGSILHNKFGYRLASLVTELLIRALTMDMNSLEALKLKCKDNSKDEHTRLEQQMAAGFMDLGEVFNKHETVARECILTAFSLHPTPDRLVMLSSLATDPPPTAAADMCSSGQSVTPVPEVTQEGGIIQGSPALCLPSTPSSTTTIIDTRDTPHSLGDMPLTQSNTPCPDLPSFQKSLRAQPDPEHMYDTMTFTEIQSSENISVQNTLNGVDGHNCVSFNELEVNSASEVQVSTQETRDHMSSISDRCSFTPQESEDPPQDRQCVTHITIDTGQSFENDVLVPNSQESQIVISESDAQIKEISLLQTKDVVEGEEIGDNDGALGDSRTKEDVDSMDKFYRSTENFIEQLSQETPKKHTQDSNTTSSSPKGFFNHYDVLTQAAQLLDCDKLGLSKELCDDLAVVLSSPRWQVLSWMLPWRELSVICQGYLNDSDSAKNMTKELKYLNIDYSQFRNMPSAEITEYTGIEKGYEHFMEYESESEYSDIGNRHTHGRAGHSSTADSDTTDFEKSSKRGRRRPKKMVNRLSDSDSDYDLTDKMKDTPRYVLSLSESEESDFDKGKTRILKMDPDMGTVIEGKRVTAVSNQDRSKRIRIDADTGKVKRDRNLLNTLRLFRHQKCGGEMSEEAKFEGAPSSPNRFAPRLSSLNLNPSVVLTERDKSIVDQQLQRSATTVVAGRSHGPMHTTPSSQPKGTWRYAGSLVAPANPTTTPRSTVPVSLPRSTSVQCYLRTKDGKVRVAPLQRALLSGARQPNPGGNGNYLRMMNKPPSSGYEDSYAKFLLQQNPALRGKGSSVTITRKNMSLDASLDYLKKQGTTVTYKSQKGSTLSLANAQKNVLNRIMSPENAISAMSGQFNNDSLPVRAIAMPVSNNPPNLPPSDKNNPTNLSRVLPKGTTVVRKPKSDGAGPSGLNNGGPSSAVGPRTVVTRPGTFSAVVPRPSVTVMGTTSRAGNSVMAVRTNASTIRTTYSRGVVGTSTMGLQETANSSPAPTVIASASGTVTTATGGPAVTTSSMPAPLVSATVVGSVPNSGTSSLSSPLGTLGGSNGQQQQLQQPWDTALSESVCVSDTPMTSMVSGVDSTATITQIICSTRGATTCTTTVASPPGDIPAASMLETLLRDRPVPPSPLHAPSTTATTTITSALPHTLTSVVGSSGVPMTLSGEGQVTTAVMGALANTGNSGSVVIASGSGNNSGVIVASGVVGGSTSSVVVGGGGVVSGSGVVGGSSSVGEGSGGAVQQVLVPGQLVQVHTSDGSTGLGIVHSASLDLRLPAGTRVIKSSSGPIRTTTSPQQQVTGVLNQTGGRQVNVLHNVKILQNVQNRQIVRTVVVPHTVALQGLGTHPATHLKPQLVALSQGTNTSTGSVEATVVQPQPVRAKIPPSTIVQKMLGRSSLVIRTLRPQTPTTQASGESSSFEEGLGAKLQQQQQQQESDKNAGSSTTGITVARIPQDEGLGERLSHYLKTALVSSTSTQSVGTQTLTTAVKPSAGQLVNQVALNHLRGGAAAATLSLPAGVQGISGQTSSTIPTSTAPQQQASLSSLPLTPTNAVSSETLEQLREFESVFEKVSNKSGKDASDGEASTENYSNATMSSEESMIAAQLLSMANDTPAVTTSSNYVYSVPTTVYGAGGTSLTEGTYITIPSTTQAGTLILVNHGGGGTGLVTVAGTGVQGQQPPTAPSPTLSSTSSHSSIASSPSSTSSKSKKQPPKQKVVPPTTPPVVAKPKTPPPPKASTPKQPAVAKTQVEENEGTRARIYAILERYKQELVITPQQPAPRNRKNCPPPKSDGKSSSKKKSQVKKVEGSSVSSPAVSEGSVVGCPSPSPSPGPANDSSVGLPGNSSGVPTVQYTTQVVSGQGITTQGPATTGSTIISEDKIKVESGQEVVAAATPQLLQGVVVSNVKVEGGATSLPQGLGGGRVVQLIRHGGKVTAITTRQPLNKVKATGQSGPPPNVTIQGRFNMNDLMESHIATLLTGGSSPITQTPTVVNKIVQQQQAGGPQAVQQVVVQTSGGQQVLQQVAVQQLTSTPPKQQKCSVVQQLGVTNSEELLGLTSTRSIHVTLPTMPPSTIVSTPAVTTASSLTNSASVTNTPPITIAHTITSNPVNSNTQTVAVVSTPSGTSGPGPSPLSVVPASPLTPQAITVTSPSTPQPVAASPHTPSPAAELPPTPSSFQMGEESNSSEHSGGDGLGGPLPPFFTLTKSFMVQHQPQQGQQQTQQNQSKNPQHQQQQEQQRVQEKDFSSGSTLHQSNTQAPTTTQASSSPTTGSVPLNKLPQRAQLQQSHLPRKSTSVIRSGGSGTRTMVVVSGVSSDRSGARGAVASPLIVSGGGGDSGSAMSPMSGPSSLETSPATTHSRIRLASRPQDMRSSSIDSLKSDLSVEEVQIPPSPATLTKQLQSAYMTEAALSPSVSQSQHSGSSYSSPGNTHDLPFTEAQPTSDDSFHPTLTQPGYSSAPSAPNLSVTGVSLESDAGLGALASPSGDVYLHQSGAGLGLEGLEAGSLPLVAGMEGRTNSPALSDLVSAGPLLAWSPRSADSMMAQSPSLNDALTANIPLDVNHSEDSLCDSSTGFPGLFSMEGDGVSVSSSTSEDMSSATPASGVNTQQPQIQLQQPTQHQQVLQEQDEITIDLHPRESEQDHTISSTRSPTQLELPVANMTGVSAHTSQASGGDPANQDTQEAPWRFDNTIGAQNKPATNQPSVPTNGQHKVVKKEKSEDDAGPSEFPEERIKQTQQISHSKAREKKGKQPQVKEELDDIKIVAEVGMNKKEKKSASQNKSDGTVELLNKNSAHQEGNNRKRSQRLATTPERRKSSFQNEVDGRSDEVPTKNGHDEDSSTVDIKSEDNSTGRSKRRISQRNAAASPNSVVQNPSCRSRVKSVKSEGEIKEEDDLSGTNVECKSDYKEGCDEALMRTTRGAKRRSEGDILGDLKRGRGTRSGRRSDGDVLKIDDDMLNHLDEDCGLARGIRGRHVSGTSDTSSNYSTERAVTPGSHDSPNTGSGRRRRRLSQESSASSRDGSPPTVHSHDFSPGGVNTRRSSSRDHAKKKKCSCCVGGEQKKVGSGSGRRSSTRATRGSSSGSLQ
ncbi:mucin-17-like isoform X2 [Penaeus japonicus]|uniref:mucin-17-like isoform X2 n=1 Tax=Penaeus japonicus TaxID=27405 RepID=UPI001C70E9A3|nr:mucin-17-like isoform X2 [Penaeus japonicus]